MSLYPFELVMRLYIPTQATKEQGEMKRFFSTSWMIISPMAQHSQALGDNLPDDIIYRIFSFISADSTLQGVACSFHTLALVSKFFNYYKEKEIIQMTPIQCEILWTRQKTYREIACKKVQGPDQFVP